MALFVSHTFHAQAINNPVSGIDAMNYPCNIGYSQFSTHVKLKGKKCAFIPFNDVMPYICNEEEISWGFTFKFHIKTVENGNTWEIFLPEC